MSLQWDWGEYGNGKRGGAKVPLKIDGDRNVVSNKKWKLSYPLYEIIHFE